MILAISATVFAAEVKVTGDTMTSVGVRFLSVETIGPDGKGTDWLLVKEVTDPASGVVTKTVVLKSGEKSFDGWPVNAWWGNIAAGRIFVRFVPGTDDHPAFVETKTVVVMPCAGWGGDKGGSFKGICQFAPESGELSVILVEGATVLSVVPGAQSATVYTVSDFDSASPVVSGKDAVGNFGSVFLFPS